MLDFVLSLVRSKAGTVGRLVGKSESEVMTAIDEGRKLLPEIKSQGAGVLQRLGVDRGFVDDMYKRYGKFADRIPGYSRAKLDSDYVNLAASLDRTGSSLRAASPKVNTEPNREQRRAARKRSGGFDSSKYPRV